MTLIAAKPHFIEVKFRVGADEYTEHVTSAKFSKGDQPKASYRDIGGKTHQRIGKPSRNLELGIVQDWTATGLARMFWDHEGEIADVEYETSEGVFGASVNIVSPDPGGDGGTFATDKLTLPVDGEVTFTPTPAGP